MRAFSTVLDVAVFLLLVSAAIAVLTVPPSSPPPAEVGAVASTLGTATLTVEYPLTMPVDTRDGPHRLTDGRQTNGTVASLLATAAVADAAFGRSLPAHAGYHRALQTRVRRLLRGLRQSVRVEARWVPYRDAPLEGEFVVGPRPPESVGVATLDVAAPLPATRAAARAAAADGFEAVARTVAAATVRGTVPPRQLRLALQGGGLGRALALARYRTLGNALGIDRPTDLAARRVEVVNRNLVAALTDRFEADMRRHFASPAAAARAVTVGRVRLVVRGWGG